MHHLITPNRSLALVLALLVALSLAPTATHAQRAARPQAVQTAASAPCPQGGFGPPLTVVEPVGSLAGAGSKLAVSGTLAYVNNNWQSMSIIDASKPISPTLRGTYPAGGPLRVAGNLAYIATRTDGLHIVDVSVPSSPKLRGKVNRLDKPLNQPFAIDLAGSRAYVSDANGLTIIDVTNPAAPAVLGHYDQINILDVRLVGSLAYLAVIFDGLVTLDVGNPASPIVRDSSPLDGGASSLAIAGSKAYVVSANGCLQVFDLTNPAAPLPRGRLDWVGRGNGVAVAGSLVYLSSPNSLKVIDVADPDRPVLRGGADIDSYDVAYANQLVYTIGGSDGLHIWRPRPDLFQVESSISLQRPTLENYDRSFAMSFALPAGTLPFTATYSGMITPLVELNQQIPVRSFRLETWRQQPDGFRNLVKEPYTMVISYTETQLANLGVDERALDVVILTDAGVWQSVFPCQGCVIDQTRNRVTVRLATNRGLSDVALVGDEPPAAEQHSVFLPMMLR